MVSELSAKVGNTVGGWQDYNGRRRHGRRRFAFHIFSVISCKVRSWYERGNISSQIDQEIKSHTQFYNFYHDLIGSLS